MDRTKSLTAVLAVWASLLFLPSPTPADEPAAPDAWEASSPPDPPLEAPTRQESAECANPTEFTVYWKDGLRMDTCDQAFRFRLGGRVVWDATIWNANGAIETTVGDDLRNGTEFRAARLYLSGEMYRHIVFKAEYDFANDEGADFKDVYIGLQDVLVDGSQLLVGNAKVPFSLEEMTSSRFITFMERGLPNVFANGREAGLHVSAPWARDRILTAIAVSQTAEDDQFGHSGNDFNVTGRLVAVPYSDVNNRLVHLGIAYGYQMLEDNEARYQQRPEAHNAPSFVDTGVFDAEDAHTVGVEAAAVFESFSIQGEYMRSFLNSGSTSDPEFSGYYVFGSWFPTGEHREYKMGKGTFDRVRVKRPFLVPGGGPGAWEIAVRYSHLDLDDSGVTGGELANVTAAVNWHLNPNARMMLNYVFADLDGVADTDAFMIRTQIDF